MKIVIDARMYGLEYAGIGRYIMNLIDQIGEIDKQNRYYILLRKKYFLSLNFDNPQIHKVLADYSHYSFIEQFLLPLQLIKLKPDLAHFPHFNVPIFWFGDYVVTIHDLIKHQFRGPETTTRGWLFYWFKYSAYRMIVWLAIKRAKMIITPSEWWKRVIAKKYQVIPDRIIVTYEGADEFLKRNRQEKTIHLNLHDLGINKPFILYVGNLYPHKNVDVLAKAVYRLHKKLGLTLVTICPRNVFCQRFASKIEKMGMGNIVKVVGFMDNEKLSSLYQQAETFVFPSFLEGFGLPGLEAMAMGLPVIASNSSCLPEVYQDAAIYFDPHDLNDLVDKIERVVGNEGLRKRLISSGYAQVKKYSWSKMARETVKTYERSLSL